MPGLPFEDHLGLVEPTIAVTTPSGAPARSSARALLDVGLDVAAQAAVRRAAARLPKQPRSSSPNADAERAPYGVGARDHLDPCDDAERSVVAAPARTHVECESVHFRASRARRPADEAEHVAERVALDHKTCLVEPARHEVARRALRVAPGDPVGAATAAERVEPGEPIVEAARHAAIIRGLRCQWCNT